MTNHTTITFETETCSRCGGSGQYPSPMWQGMCLGCNGTGRKLTRAGKVAHKRFHAAMLKMCVPMTEVEVGDKVKQPADAKWRTVTEVLDNSGIGHRNDDGTTTWLPGFVAGNTVYSVSPDAQIMRYSQELFEEAVASVAHLKGATITRPDAPDNVVPVPKSSRAPRMSHAGHDHPNTAVARAACRKASSNAA